MPNLPQYATPFVGRLTEAAEIINRLKDPDCRLLTLVGPGGIGKTRLAIQVAAQCADQYPDGVYFASLQPLNSPEFMVPTVANAVGLQFYPGDNPKQQLLDYFRDRTLLLVLDNLEHLLDGAGLLSEIVEAAPYVCLLGTSRERLNLIEEWMFDVRELNYPTSAMETDIEAYDAVQLFVAHARRVQSDFVLTAREKPAVTHLCQLVGGMPLGIELAAAWVRSLSIDEIAHEIERGLDILETPVRNIEPRHRNIRAAFEPMWHRMTEEQRGVFGKLSVFRGGFTREAAEYVTGGSLRALSALVDKSLVHMDRGGRYDLHELLRQYAEERLRESPGGLKDVHEKHCRYFTAFLAQKEKDLEGRRQKETLEEIQREIDNVRTAWQWAVEHKGESEIAQATHALWFFYDTRGWYPEGEQAFRAAVEALGMNGPNEEKDRALGTVLAHYGRFLESKQGRKLLEEGLTILRHHDARQEIGFALLRLSEFPLFYEDDPLAARDYLQESLNIFRDLGNWWGMAYSLRWLGFAAFHLGELEDARRLAQEGLEIYRENGDQWGTAISLSVVGFCLLEQGAFAESKRIGQECVALCKEIGLVWARWNGQLVIAAANCALKEYEETRQILRETLDLVVDHQVMIYVLAIVEETARLMIAMGEIEQAVAMLVFVSYFPVPSLLGKGRTTRYIASLQKELPDAVFAAAAERGEMLELEMVVQACRDVLRPGSPLFQASQADVDPLTARELEVLQLIVDGLTNQEIAKRLVISVSTTKKHNSNIFSKPAVKSRTQAIARARELKLAH